MDVQKIARQVRLRHWMGLIEECQNSGMTVKGWCSAQGINLRVYYYWLKKTRESVCLEAGVHQNQPQQDLSIGTPVFAEVGMISGKSSVITVYLSGAEVVIHNGASANLIENTLRVLKNIC